jgi:hypothetical protein
MYTQMLYVITIMLIVEYLRKSRKPTEREKKKDCPFLAVFKEVLPRISV